MSDFTQQDRRFMQRVLVLAQKAAQADEVPIAAILVRDNQLIAEGYNQSIGSHDASAHAEINCIRQAGKKEQNYRLPETTLYTSLEPCSMCAGALIHARVKRLVFAAHDKKAGAVCSVHQLLDSNPRQHRVNWQGGLFEKESSQLLSDFFREKRMRQKR